MTRKNILVTGPPRCGKSTLIEAVVSTLDRPAIGFFTRETRETGRRTGFEIVTLDGKRGILAHERTRSTIHVGKYGVNLEDLDRIAVPSIVPADADQVVVIDEIGKMECLSALFRETLVRTLDSPNLVIGSIAIKGDSFIQGIKKRSDVESVVVSERNRDMLAKSLPAAFCQRNARG